MVDYIAHHINGENVRTGKEEEVHKNYVLIDFTLSAKHTHTHPHTNWVLHSLQHSYILGLTKKANDAGYLCLYVIVMCVCRGWKSLYVRVWVLHSIGTCNICCLCVWCFILLLTRLIIVIVDAVHFFVAIVFRCFANVGLYNLPKTIRSWGFQRLKCKLLNSCWVL